MWRLVPVLATGCLMTGSNLGARTPPAGTQTYGVVTRGVGNSDMFAPQLDLTAAHAVTDDLALHARLLVMAAGVEIAARYRFLASRRVHLALAPSAAAAYRRASRGTEDDEEDLGPDADLLGRISLLVTLDAGAFDVDVAGFGGISHLVESSAPPGDAVPYGVWQHLYAHQGTAWIGGAALGLGVDTGTWRVRPSVEWVRSIARHAAPAAAPMFERVDVWSFSVAWER